MDESMSQWNRREVLRAAGAVAATGSLTTMAKAQWAADEELNDPRISCVTSTEKAAWAKGKLLKSAFSFYGLNLNVEPEKAIGGAIEGFGGCFNELGWKALELLSEADRETVLAEFFDPEKGGRFNYCRMPLGANDFSVEAYSYDEQDGDFELKNFSIEHDRKSLIPFIKAAKRHQPELRLWASPWTPPSWMKRNHFYAEAPGMGPFKPNGIKPEQIGHEGEDFFIQKPEYFAAYARYFGRFVDAYGAEGIRIGMVMPQNEFNSAQNFPSCTWTPEGLARFVKALGPEMRRRDVAIFFGTLERGNPQLLEKVLEDPEAAKYIKGVGIQWAGKNALPEVLLKHPELQIFQSEQECGDGSNSWGYAGYCWHLMKHYLANGARGYMYWNLALVEGEASTWGWPQNALVTVDSNTRSFRYTHDYTMLKHLTHAVEKGARLVAASGTFSESILYRNPDGSVVALLRNEAAHPKRVDLRCGRDLFTVELAADSISTVKIRKS